MKILLLVFTCLLVSCSTKVAGKNEEKQFLIVTKNYKGKDVLSAPQVTVLEGNLATIRIVEERHVPIKWLSPETLIDNGTENVLPATPLETNCLDIGVTLETTAYGVRAASLNDLIHIQGRIILRETPNTRQGLKEENKLLREHVESYNTDTCNYSLFIKNNNSRRMEFKSGGNTFAVEFFAKEISTEAMKSSFSSGLPDFKNL